MTRRAAIGLRSDDAPFGRRMADYLSRLGFDLCMAGGGTALAVPEGVDVLILDVAADEDGLEVVRRFRDATSARIVTLNPCHDPADFAAMLEIGIDDTLAKPVDLQELAARIRGILRRHGIARGDLVRLENTTADLGASCLLRQGCLPERLAAGEVALLRAFARNPHRVLTRDDLLDAAAAERLDANDRAIDSRVARLRRKLETRAIITVRGYGYMFVPPFEAPRSASTDRDHETSEHRRPQSSSRSGGPP